MKNINRRALVAGTIAAAVAVPASAQCVLPHADQQLLDLGVRLERLIIDYAQQHRESQARLNHIQRLTDREIAELNTDGIEVDECQATVIRWEVVDRMPPRDPRGDEESEDRLEEMQDQLYDVLADEILAIEPTTLEGLAVHARLISVVEMELWEGSEYEQVAKFVSLTCRFLGTRSFYEECS